MDNNEINENMNSTQNNPYQDMDYGYSQDPYRQQDNTPDKKPDENIGLSIASMVCGILSIILCCAGVAGIILSVAALVLGIVSLKKKAAGRGMAIAGIATGAVGLLLAIIMIVLALIGYLSDVDSILDNKILDRMNV